MRPASDDDATPLAAEADAAEVKLCEEATRWRALYVDEEQYIMVVSTSSMVCEIIICERERRVTTMMVLIEIITITTSSSLWWLHASECSRFAAHATHVGWWRRRRPMRA